MALGQTLTSCPSLPGCFSGAITPSLPSASVAWTPSNGSKFKAGPNSKSHPGPSCPLKFLADSGTGVTDKACEPGVARNNRMKGGDPVGRGHSWP